MKTTNKVKKAVLPENLPELTPADLDDSPNVYPNEVLAPNTFSEPSEVSNEQLGIPTPAADEFKNMPDEWKERNNIPVDETGVPNPNGFIVEDTVNVPERTIAGMTISDGTKKILDDWDASLNDPYRGPLTAGALKSNLIQDPINDDRTALDNDIQPGKLKAVPNSKTDGPVKLGAIVLFGGRVPAIVTGVWEDDVLNLTLFPDALPVLDIKTRVPYGEGQNTWKEIN